MTEERKIRVLMAKPGLDGHVRGVQVVSLALRDAGMEVIYTGMRQTITQIVEAAIQEDVDVVGLSILSGSHISATDGVVKLLKERGIRERVIVLVGGVIPSQADIDKLMELGADCVFPFDTRLEDIVNFIQNKVAAKRAAT